MPDEENPTEPLELETTEPPGSVNNETAAAAFQSNPLRSVPIEVVVSIGKATPKVSEFVRLRCDSVLPLNARIDDLVEVYVGERLIARGELQELDGENQGQLSVRLTEVADLSDGV